MMITTIFKRATTTVLLLTCALIVSGRDMTRAQDDSRRIVYGLTFQPSGFDPHINASSELGIPLRSVYDTLVYRDPVSQAFVAGLAESWAISEDGREYTFTLRQNVLFHDGTPFNASAVAANLDRITDPAIASQKAVFLLGGYAGYSVIDDRTIRIALNDPYSPLLDSLSQVYLGMASPTALAAYSAERYQFYQVGTGPFVFVEYVPGDRLVLRRNPAYVWGPSFYQPVGANAVETIEFRFFTDPVTRALALESGEADIMGELLPLDARALNASTEVSLQPEIIPGQPLQFLINSAKFPTDELVVRQALLVGADREAIADSIFQRLSPVAWAPLSAATPYYNADLVGAYAFDPAAARDALIGLGYSDSNNDGVLERNGAELEIRVITPVWNAIPDVVQLLEAQWRTIGIRTVIEQVPSRGALFEQVAAGDYHLVAWYEYGSDPAYLSRYFTSMGDLNWTGYSAAELDGLLIEAGRQSDDNARRSLYGQAQRIVMEQALILPIRDYVNLNGYRRTLNPVEFDAYGWFPLLHNLSFSTFSGE
ncbi:MAG: ABC transporter substrate-binding protein [Chloroflexota bacterium]|nr:ABC transporter substrate-binding protein [Chloroflexota bacterium]